MADENVIPRPWKYSRKDFTGKTHPFHFYITGDHAEDEDGRTCTGFGIVVGNETSGVIPEATADFLCRAANCHADLLAACKFALAVMTSPSPVDGAPEIAAHIYLERAIAKAEAQ